MSSQTNKFTLKRPTTTLFLLSSVDGKLSTGSTDELDFDKDFPEILGLREGLYQYYEIEQTTDLWSFNSGKVMAKIGVNSRKCTKKVSVSFVLVDNKHLNVSGVNYLCDYLKEFVLITTNKNHPAYNVKRDNFHIIYQDELNLNVAFATLKSDYGVERLTLQSGGTLNALLLRNRLIDYVDIVVAPVLVGGKDTTTVVDGPSLTRPCELLKLGVLELEGVEKLEKSYIRLKYKVINHFLGKEVDL